MRSRFVPWLRIEGLIVLVVAIVLYRAVGSGLKSAEGFKHTHLSGPS